MDIDLKNINSLPKLLKIKIVLEKEWKEILDS